MKLYYSQGACSLASHIVLHELGIPFEARPVNWDTDSAEVTALNPLGVVPVLALDDGKPLTEGAAILQYLADRKPELGLAPQAGTMERYRLQETLNFLATEVHKTYSPLFSIERMSEDAAVREQMRAFWVQQVGARLELLQSRLSRQDWMLPWGYTVADAYAFTLLGWSQWLKVDLGKWPALPKYLERVAARPAVQKALKAEKLA